MMHRNAGKNHWWRSSVLTSANKDTDKRPIFDDATADEIFDELINRDLLVQSGNDMDGSGVPAYTMKYDIDGWDKSVSDGRPIYAFLLKVKRSWLLISLTFIFGCVLTTLENRVVGFIDGLIETATEQNKE